MEIIPSIVPKDYFDIEEKIRIVEGFVDWVHLDVVDGKFAKPTSWPYNQDDIDNEIKSLNDIDTSLNIGLHLMTKNPEEDLDEWIDTPLKRITIHAESTENLEHALTILEMSKTETGVALNLDTPIEILEDVIKHVDFIHLMSIYEIGGYGAEYSSDVLKKIEEIKNKYPDVLIEVDGGVSKNNIKELKKAGVSNFVVGSAIFKHGDPIENIENLKREIES